MGKIVAACVLAIAIAQPAVAENAPWRINKDVLSCPKVVNASQQFLIAVSPGAGRELAVRRVSDNAWFFLVVASPPDSQHNLLSPIELRHGKTVTIPLNLRWPKWTADAKLEPVFQRGAYELYLSENLESEIGGYKCAIEVKI